MFCIGCVEVGIESGTFLNSHLWFNYLDYLQYSSCWLHISLYQKLINMLQFVLSPIAMFKLIWFARLET